jgi:sec-independent protein translocase protein TatC
MPLDQVDIDGLEDEEGKEMSFFDHLEELRWHLIRSMIAITICGIGVFSTGKWFFDRVIFWPKSDDFLTYRAICWFSDYVGLKGKGCFTPDPFDISALKLEEMFITHIKVSVIVGFIIAFPYVFWEIWRFISPGLKSTERRYTRGTVFTCSLLFLLGVAFGYFVISPFAVSFLSGYEISAQVKPDIQLSSFVTSMTMFTVPAGLVFELPVIVFFLSKVGLVTPEVMKAYRRHALLLVFLLAALITPPDVVTQFLIGIPLYILYEISISISRRVVETEKKRENSMT